MQETGSASSGSASIELLARLSAFFFPGGEAAARLIRSIRTTQSGEIRMSPGARWVPFTAQERIDATQSSFCWDARMDPGKLVSTTVTDAYENGHGRLVARVGGLVPVMNLTGPDADKGEIQRYLSSIVFCPAILLNNPSLVFSAADAFSLSVCDRDDPTAAVISLQISADGAPVACHAHRPRMAGKQTILTPWTATCAKFKEWEGLRVATHLDVSWQLPEGPFPYFRSEITSFTAVR